MSAHIIEFPRLAELPHPQSLIEVERHPITNHRKLETSEFVSRVIYLSQFTLPPTPEDLRREQFLLECD